MVYWYGHKNMQCVSPSWKPLQWYVPYSKKMLEKFVNHAWKILNPPLVEVYIPYHMDKFATPTKLSKHATDVRGLSYLRLTEIEWRKPNTSPQSATSEHLKNVLNLWTGKLSKFMKWKNILNLWTVFNKWDFSNFMHYSCMASYISGLILNMFVFFEWSRSKILNRPHS